MKLPFVILLAFTGIHCGKSVMEKSQESFSQANIAPEVIGKQQLLTREVSFTSNNPDLKRVREFSYDDQDRCTQVIVGTIDSSKPAPVLTVSRVLTFFYDGASLLPYKAATVRTVFPNLVTDYFYKYDEKGIKVQDSVRVLNQANEPADRVVNYQYGKDLIVATPELTGFPIFFNPFDSLFTDNANIIKKVSTTPTPNGDQVLTFTFEYDKKINPYAAINIYNSLYFTNPALGIGYNVPTESHYIGFNRNNITAFSLEGFKTVVVYEYDKFKYPVKSETFAEEDPSFKTTTYFTYKDKH